MSLRKVLDKDGNKFDFYSEVREHITKYHQEIKNIETIENILSDPDVVVESSLDKNSNLYYKKFKHLYRVVIVQTKEKRRSF